MTYVNNQLVDTPLAKMIDNKQKRVIDSRSVRFILVSVIAVGTFYIYPTFVNSSQNSIVHTVKNLDWDWTGFGEIKVTTKKTETKTEKDGKITISEQTHPGKKLWDWLELNSRLAVPILLAFFGHRVQLQREKEQKDNLAEEAIQKYLDDMANLLLDKELTKQLFPNNKCKSVDNRDYDNPVTNVVSLKTIVLLKRLEEDKKRQNIIIYFLRTSKLYEFIFEKANLEKVNLHQANLEEANFHQAFLWKANLQQANLEEANLQQAKLYQANLQGANLYKAKLQQAKLKGANLEEANLQQANLQGANLEEANLQGANLEKANLQGTLIGKVRVEKVEQPTTQEEEEINKVFKVLEKVVKDLNSKKIEQIEEIKEIEQFKSACCWDKAIYIGRWCVDKGLAESAEPYNKKYIDKLSKIIVSDK